MSYQEYAQLGKGARRKPESKPSRRKADTSPDRPYVQPVASFSVPRGAAQHNSSRSISSASLSPSNSASQQDDSSPASEWPSKPLPAVGVRSLDTDLSAEKQPDLVNVPLQWRPFYLHRKVLLSFACTFVGLIIIVEALGDYSNRNAGLGPSDTGLRYLWTCAPVLILTLVLGLWSRVDYQAKSSAPWLRMSKGSASADKTLLLDYVSATHLSAMMKALRHGDTIVACTAVVSIVLRALIVLSTALATLSVVDAPDTGAQITLHTTFVNDATGLSDAGSLSFYTMLSLQRDNMSFPDGASSRFAYQQFSAEIPPGTEANVTVDGFMASLDCAAAQLATTGVQSTAVGIQINTNISSQGCSVPMPIVSNVFAGSSDPNQPRYFARLGRGGCGGSNDPNDQRVIAVFGMERGAAGSANIPRSTQLLCKPTYSISRVDVRKRDAVVIAVDLSRPARNRSLDQVQPWDIAQAVFNSLQTDFASSMNDTTPPTYLPEFLNVDPAMYLALSMRRAAASNVTSASAFFDTATLQGAAQDYFRQHAAIVAAKSLVEETSPSAPGITGSVLVHGERLTVTTLVVHLMAFMLGTCFILACIAMSQAPQRGYLPRDPNTLIGLTTLIAHSRPLLQTLRGSGGSEVQVLRERLRGSEYSTGVERYENSSTTDTGYFKILGVPQPSESGLGFAEERNDFPYPTSLHPATRISAFCLVVAAIVCLEIPLRYSENNNGFGDIDVGTSTHLLWTVGPALLLTIFAVYFASADFMTRAMTPYAALRRDGTFQNSVNVNYLDKFAPAVVWDAAISRNLAVIASTAALLTSCVLVVFAAPLFSAVAVPATTSVDLISKDFFAQSGSLPDATFCGKCRNGTIISSLVLNSNMSYPPFTYEDLNFPALSMNQIADGVAIPKDIAVTASLPAVRPAMSCKMFAQSDIKADVTFGTTFAGRVNPLRITLPGETGSSDAANGSTFVIATSQAVAGNGNNQQNLDARDVFFGATDHKTAKLANGTVTSRWIYTWGQLADANTDHTTVLSVSGMSCNESLEQVTAMTTLFGTSLAILPSTPPEVDESTVESTTAALGADASNLYLQLANVSTTDFLDAFFASLVASRYAIPVEELGDGDAAQSVADAVVRQHKVIRTQVLSEWNRRRTSTSLSANGGGAVTGNVSVAVFPGTLTSQRIGDSTTAGPLVAHQRLVQDMAATRVLQALLGATLAFAIASWALQPRPNVIPRLRSGAALSIASSAALLADGNLFGLLGRGAEWRPTSEVREAFMDGLHVTMRFRLGWEAARRRRRGEMASGPEEKVFGIGAVRTGGWGGGEGVGLGLQARVGYVHRDHVRDWGWRT